MSLKPARLLVRQSVALCVLVVSLAALAVPALAGDTHVLRGSFDGSATPAGAFNDPRRMAIDHDADVLYVLDGGNGAVVKYDLSGDPAAPVPADFSALSSPVLDGAGTGEADETPQGTVGLTGDSAIAVDNTGGANDGNVYIASETGYLYAFDETGNFLYALDGTDPDGTDPLEGTPTSSLDNPCGVAVGSDGTVYVSGYYAAAVRKFTPTGSTAGYTGEVSTVNPACHIAVDSTGQLYANHYSGDVERYDSTGASQGVVDPGPAYAVSVAPDDHLFVTRGDRVVEYDDAGAQVSDFGAGTLGWSWGTAAGGSANHVYATDSNTNQIHVFGPLENVAPPTAEIDPVTDPGSTTADLAGQVDPQGYNTTARFEYSANGTDWTQLPVHDSSTDPALADSTDPVALTDQATGLEPNTDYQARLTATNPGGTTTSDPVSFHTDAEAPVVQTLPADLLTGSTAFLGGRVNPRNSATTYRFEYSTDPAFPTSETTTVPVPDADAGDGGQPVTVTRTIDGLQPETTYHYRLVAENQVSEVTGDGVAFTTKQAPAGQAACPNAKYRTGPSAKLPDCRAYEQVSPTDKNGADIKHYGPSFFASPDGEAVGFASFGSFAGAPGTGTAGLVQYAARRTPDGWGTIGATPLPAPDAFQLLVMGTNIMAFSEDLSRAFVHAYDLPGATDDIAKNFNYYIGDVASGSLATVTKPLAGETVPLNYFGNTTQYGVTPDLSVVTFGTHVNMVPESIDFTPRVYRWEDGTVRLESILPDGTIPPQGAVMAGGDGGGPWQNDTTAADGSWTAFISPPVVETRQLYIRKNGAETVWISEPETESPAPSPSNVYFEGATPDGRHLLFTTDSRLTEDDPGGTGRALYRYTDSEDPETDANLTFIARPVKDQVSTGSALIGISDDAERVYYSAAGDSVWLWDHGTTTQISDDPGFGQRSSRIKDQDARVTSDGRYLAFTGSQAITAASRSGTCLQEINLANNVTPCQAMYLYDAETDSLTCVSCPPDGEGSRSNAFVSPRNNHSKGTAGGVMPFRPHFLSDDGEVFFSTGDALMADDQNGDIDAYAYDPRTGQLDMMSTGGPGDSWFAEASADGNDVFIVTRDRLVGHDRDNLMDLYDARVGGGLDEPAVSPPPCTGDACQESAAGVDAPDEVGSRRLEGRGNLGQRSAARFTLAPISVAQRRVLARTGRLVLRVRTPRAGTVRVRSGATVPVVKRVRSARAVKLVVRLRREARIALRDRGRLRTRLVVSFGASKRTAVLRLRAGSR